MFGFLKYNVEREKKGKLYKNIVGCYYLFYSFKI